MNIYVHVSRCEKSDVTVMVLLPPLNRLKESKDAHFGIHY